MLTFEQIKELMERVAELGLGRVEYERSGFKLTIVGETTAPAAPPAAAHNPPPLPAAAPEPSSETTRGGTADAEPAGDEEPHRLTSPLVGTFYRAPSPDAEPFVAVGDEVSAGQIVCIVEAMKLMNEVESDVAGTVVAIHPDNATAVEFGSPLFDIRVDD